MDTPWGGRKGLILKNPFGSSIRRGVTWRAKGHRPSKSQGHGPSTSTEVERRAFGSEKEGEGGIKHEGRRVMLARLVDGEPRREI